VIIIGAIACEFIILPEFLHYIKSQATSLQHIIRRPLQVQVHLQDDRQTQAFGSDDEIIIPINEVRTNQVNCCNDCITYSIHPKSPFQPHVC